MSDASQGSRNQNALPPLHLNESIGNNGLENINDKYIDDEDISILNNNINKTLQQDSRFITSVHSKAIKENEGRIQVER